MTPPNEIDSILSRLQLATAKALLDKIESGEATAADFNVARQMCKDNDIQAPRGANPHLDSIALRLPFPDQQEQVA